MEHLSEDMQFKEVLNDEEIKCIKDPERRNLRMKFWQERHEIFQNEKKYSDAECLRLTDLSRKAEAEALVKYKKEKGID